MGPFKVGQLSTHMIPQKLTNTLMVRKPTHFRVNKGWLLRYSLPSHAVENGPRANPKIGLFGKMVCPLAHDLSKVVESPLRVDCGISLFFCGVIWSTAMLMVLKRGDNIHWVDNTGCESRARVGVIEIIWCTNGDGFSNWWRRVIRWERNQFREWYQCYPIRNQHHTGISSYSLQTWTIVGDLRSTKS